MTRSQRNQFTTQWKKTLLAIERRYIGRIYKALKDQLQGVVDDVRVGGIEYAKRRLSSLQFNMGMTQTIQDMHRSVGLMMARRTYDGLKKVPVVQKATIGMSQEWIDEIIEYFRLHLLESVQSISNTTRNHVLEVLEKGFQQGWSFEEIARTLNNREYIGHRAEVIVRTESVRAANFGVQKGAEKYEYEVIKEWVAIRDDRTRHSHMVINEQQRDLGDTYSNGLLFPGDPEGSPAETIMCRCTQVIEPVRDKDGKLIPKPQPTLRPGATNVINA